MPKGIALNIYLPAEDVRILDAIAQTMGKGEIGITPNRSQLVTKAIENFIDACRRRDDLRETIEAVQSELEKETAARNRGSKNASRLQVVQPAS